MASPGWSGSCTGEPPSATSGPHMSVKDLARRRLRHLRHAAYGVHDWDDLLEKQVRCPPLLRPSLRDLGRHVPLVVRERQLLFVHVPKNGGTSVASALYGSMTGHMTALFHQAVDPAFFAAASPFATLRDPVDRFVSAYWFIVRGGGSEVKLGEWFARSCKGIASIDDLLAHVEANIGDIYSIDHVVRPQVWYLSDASGRLIVDRLFLLGRDDAQLADFLRGYGVDRLPVLNTTAKESLTLTSRQRDRILAIYAKDVALVQSRTIASGDLRSAV
jgi:hypothetical protein